MCVVSMVGDHYADKWRGTPWADHMVPDWPLKGDSVSRDEFNKLKRDVLEMKYLLKRAKEYDERNGEPICEVDEKMDLLRRVAKLVGVDLEDVIGAKA